jgi:chain length determinant protein EpsF
MKDQLMVGSDSGRVDHHHRVAMPTNPLLHLLMRRWKLVLLLWLLAIGAALGMTAVLPRQYLANASLVLEVKPDPIAGSYPGLVSNSLVATQVDVLTSERVARRVIRNLRLLDNPALKAQWQQQVDAEQPMDLWLLEMMRQRLDVRPSRESNVIQVAYRALDGKTAAAMANGFVQAYLDTALELRVEPARQFSTFFDERSRDARASLSSAQQRLAAFEQSEGLIVTDERLDIENARLAELSTQVAAALGQRSDAASRVQASKERPLEELPDVLGHTLIAGLRAEHTRQAARLEELDARLGPRHPQRLEAAAGLAELEQRLDEETRRVGAGIESHHAISQARLASLQVQLAAQRERVMRLRAARNEASVLSREVDNAQRSYDALMGRQQLTQLESQTTQAQANWLSVATPPAQADSPKPLLNGALAAFFGAVLAVVVAWWLESRSPSERSRESA